MCESLMSHMSSTKYIESMKNRNENILANGMRKLNGNYLRNEKSKTTPVYAPFSFIPITFVPVVVVLICIARFLVDYLSSETRTTQPYILGSDKLLSQRHGQPLLGMDGVLLTGREE